LGRSEHRLRWIVDEHHRQLPYNPIPISRQRASSGSAQDRQDFSSHSMTEGTGLSCRAHHESLFSNAADGFELNSLESTAS
jgi:hypothetical protein